MAKTRNNQTVSKRGIKGEGRPKAVIDYARLRKLARIQCTQEEMASVLDVCVDTLQRDERAMQIYRDGMAHGRMSVRRAQFRAMLQGNQTMLVWLGKQYLGQRDHQELSGPAGGPMQVEVSNRSPIDVARRIAFLFRQADEAINKAKQSAAAAEG